LLAVAVVVQGKAHQQVAVVQAAIAQVQVQAAVAARQKLL
jgi:hypothetical protein